MREKNVFMGQLKGVVMERYVRSPFWRGYRNAEKLAASHAYLLRLLDWQVGELRLLVVILLIRRYVFRFVVLHNRSP
jgi:hypothetical protein